MGLRKHGTWVPVECRREDCALTTSPIATNAAAICR